MSERLRIEFQITLNDWLEFRRREQPAFRLSLLRLADVLWAPLLVLLALSILLVAASLLSVPAWLPIPILILVAASHVYRSLPTNTATRKAESEWKREFANVDCSAELIENGFEYVAGSSTYRPSWAVVGSVYQTEHLIIFTDHHVKYALLFPKRAFTSEKQLQEFLEIAHQKTVVER